jgi:hypothetical protein
MAYTLSLIGVFIAGGCFGALLMATMAMAGRNNHDNRKQR